MREETRTDLENRLRKARLEDDTEAISLIKEQLGILTRNVTTTTVRNKRGNILSVRQNYTVVPIQEQEDTKEIEVVLQ